MKKRVKLVQFIPNKSERYAAALRKIITKRLTNKKDTEKSLKLLKIITVFSALSRDKSPNKVKLQKNCKFLLMEACLKYEENGKNLVCSLEGEENYEIDYSLLRLLVLELISTSIKDEVFIKGFFLKNRIIFAVKNTTLTHTAKALIKKLNGIFIKERAESNFAVMLSAHCVLKTENLSEDTEDFNNFFSSVNIMLFQ